MPLTVTDSRPVVTCSCGRAYTTEQFRKLPLVGHQADGDGGWLELRQCACAHSTISQPATEPPRGPSRFAFAGFDGDLAVYVPVASAPARSPLVRPAAEEPIGDELTHFVLKPLAKTRPASSPPAPVAALRVAGGSR